ncbi:MAG: type II toxin-antitoxin system HipA family toxin [Bacteroidetes bacterium]|nr:type II toxin-antitoxin system HipA family toxin [Bacteroidota bacterium]MBU1116022.1 type II toxin-antitoxin system HipA family toxin [Bacteroidota bacterium]MBU1799210.1 type II toxin-antitoxin system HipA family toxin [Bacteroidota bacterium]
MIKVAKVKIWNNVVGAIAWNENTETATFEYDKSFLKSGLNIAPLTMPLEKAIGSKNLFSFPALNKETYKGLPGLLADSLPDAFGNKIIDSWLAQQGRDPNSFNSIERLCYTGKRGMGALEYEPILSPSDSVSNKIEIDELVKLAGEILSDRKTLEGNIHKTSDDLLKIISVGTSAGGARAKAIIAYNPITGDVRSGQIDGLENYEYWIIKFDGVTNKALGDPKGYGKIEFAYYLMAKDAGINIMDSKILTENNRTHFMTKRFDRIGNTKLHMQTLCAIAHFDYSYSNAYSYEQAFQVMRQLKLAYSQMEELLRRMVFNVIARNQDDHTKNISFLMDKAGNWSLSPAYDITYAYDPANKWMKAHQMSINGKRENINSEDILELAKNMNIKKAANIIDEVVESVSKWRLFANEAGIPNEQIDAIEKTLIMDLK